MADIRRPSIPTGKPVCLRRIHRTGIRHPDPLGVWFWLTAGKKVHKASKPRRAMAVYRRPAPAATSWSPMARPRVSPGRASASGGRTPSTAPDQNRQGYLHARPANPKGAIVYRRHRRDARYYGGRFPAVGQATGDCHNGDGFQANIIPDDGRAGRSASKALSDIRVRKAIIIVLHDSILNNCNIITLIKYTVML